MNKIINVLLKEAEKASKKNEVPISAIIVHNNKILCKSYNNREKYNDITSHAEINCIKKASRKLKTWKLDDCEMYVTLKPCSMCESVIKQSRIKNVYYLLEKNDKKKEYNKTKFLKLENTTNYDKILANFFKNKR